MIPVFRWFKRSARRQELVDDIEQELLSHLSFSADDNRRDGMPDDLAEDDALARFGNWNEVKRSCLDAVDDQPLRRLARTLSAGVPLALVFGAFAFGCILVYSVMFRPLRLDSSDRIVRVGEGWENAIVSADEFVAWRAEAESFQYLTTFSADGRVLTGAGAEADLRSMVIGNDYFSVFATKPILGRLFSNDEVEFNKEHVVLLSEGLWVSRFGRNPLVLGRSIMLDGSPHKIVGIMPKRAQLSHEVDIWTPLSFTDVAVRNGHYVAGLMRPGSRLADVQREVEAISAARIKRSSVSADGPINIEVTSPAPPTFYPLRDLYVAETQPVVTRLFGAVTIVLVLLLVFTIRIALSERREEWAAPNEWLVFYSRPVAVAVAALCGVLIAYLTYSLAFNDMLGREGTLFVYHFDGAVAAVVVGLAMLICVSFKIAVKVVAGSISSTRDIDISGSHSAKKDPLTI